MINDLPTIHEIVTGSAKKQREKSASTPNSSSKSKSSSKAVESECSTHTLELYMNLKFLLFNLSINHFIFLSSFLVSL